MSELWIGVLGGLLTAALLAFGKNVVWPRLQSILSSEPKVDGKWVAYDDADGGRVGSVKIEQAGSGVKVKVTRNLSRSGKTIDRKFSYRGHISSGTLVASFRDDSAKYQAGAIVMGFEQNPDRLSGLTIYRDADKSNQVIAQPIIWRRS